MSSRIIFAAMAIIFCASQSQAAQDKADLKANEAGVKLVHGQNREAINLFTDALSERKITSEKRASILNDRGVAYWRSDKPLLALADFNKAVKLYPEYPATYNNRGNVLLSLGQTREAIRDFDRAILLAPGYAAAFNNRANAKVKLQKYEDAIRDFTRAIKLIPQSPVAVAGRGNAQLALSRTFSALRDFSRALGLNARFGSGYGARARAYLELERYAEAIEDLTRAIAFDPKNAETYLIRGRAYLSGANFASAIADFTKAIDLRPNNSVAYTERGLAYAKTNDFDPALDDLGRAIELNHKDVSAYARRAWTYLSMNAPELGLRDVERALKINPQSAESYRVRGEIYERLGRKRDAIADFEQAVTLDPEENAAWDALAELTGVQKPGPREIFDSAFGEWRVFGDGKHYYATNDRYRRIKVPLESMSNKPPRIVDWELKQYPYKGVGVLRYEAGSVQPDDSEKAERVKVAFAAIVDLNNAKVVGIEPYRYGNKKIAWNWQDDGKLRVIGRDGVASEIQLRRVVARRRPPVDRYGNARYGNDQAIWSPWGPGFGNPGRYERRKVYRKKVRRKKKKKNFFELLFGN